MDYREFKCKQCGKCCKESLVLFESIKDKEWIPIVEFIKEKYGGIITIKDITYPDYFMEFKITSVDDILFAKQTEQDPLYWFLENGACPFIKEREDGTCFCEIHAFKPSACADYRCDLSREGYKKYRELLRK